MKLTPRLSQKMKQELFWTQNVFALGVILSKGCKNMGTQVLSMVTTLLRSSESFLSDFEEFEVHFTEILVHVK